MHVALHKYATDPSLPQRDGVNLAHENITELLRRNGGGVVSFHDLCELLRDSSYARSELANVDCVISNVGPHAHYYFHLREQLGLDFRIIRDVRTALWSSYLLQEHLCGPYLRDHDTLLVASHYARGIYEAVFPALRNSSILRCYPLTVGFPEAARRQQIRRMPAMAETFKVGYVGRLSEDKNFPDLVELLIVLNQSGARRFRLIACGDIHSPSCHPDKVLSRIASSLGSGNYFEYLPPRRNSAIWDVYERIDLLAFPSTSNLETLGRVVVEASYAGVPLLSGEHAAASELIPSASLCPVQYHRGRRYDTHNDHSLGSVSVDAMASALLRGEVLASDCYLEYQSHPEKLLDIAGAGAQLANAPEPLRLTRSQEAFIESLDVHLPVALDRDSANCTISELRHWFLTLHERGSRARDDALCAILSMSRHPERTARFIERTRHTRCDLTDVGGIDIELCHLIGFYPEFLLEQQDAATQKDAVEAGA